MLSIVVGFSMTICDVRRDQHEFPDIQWHCTGDNVVQVLRGSYPARGSRAKGGRDYGKVDTRRGEEKKKAKE
jgi:hypothetical protein